MVAMVAAMIMVAKAKITPAKAGVAVRPDGVGEGVGPVAQVSAGGLGEDAAGGGEQADGGGQHIAQDRAGAGGGGALGGQQGLEHGLHHRGGQAAAQDPGDDPLGGHVAHGGVLRRQLGHHDAEAAELGQGHDHEDDQQDVGAEAHHPAHRGHAPHPGKAGIDDGHRQTDEHGQGDVQAGDGDLDDGGHGAQLIGDVQEAVYDPRIRIQPAGPRVKSFLQVDGHRVAGHPVADELGEDGQGDEVEGARDGVPGAGHAQVISVLGGPHHRHAADLPGREHTAQGQGAHCLVASGPLAGALDLGPGVDTDPDDDHKGHDPCCN